MKGNKIQAPEGKAHPRGAPQGRLGGAETPAPVQSPRGECTGAEAAKKHPSNQKQKTNRHENEKKKKPKEKRREAPRLHGRCQVSPTGEARPAAREPGGEAGAGDVVSSLTRRGSRVSGCGKRSVSKSKPAPKSRPEPRSEPVSKLKVEPTSKPGPRSKQEPKSK